MTKKKTILILGASGLLGSIIFHRLAKTYKTIGFSHRKNNNKKILQTNYIKFSRKQISIIKNSEIIINCIGENSNEGFMKKINIEILKKISKQINILDKNKIFIHISTCGIYGNFNHILITENTQPNPKTIYSKTKYEGELILKKVLNNYCKLIILRPSQVIGESMKNTSLKKLYYYIKRKLFFYVNNQSSLFSYIFVDDLLIIIEKLLKKKNYKSQTYNVSNQITYKKLVTIIQKTLKQSFYYPSISPLIIKLIIFIFEDLMKMKIPINNKTLNSLMVKTTFGSKLIKRDLKIKKFTTINLKNLKALINE